MQTELHHIRTLKIMSDVYSRGMMTELLFEQQMVDRLFPCLDELISIHSQFFQRILERKKESLVDKSERNFLIRRIGDVLITQVCRGPGALSVHFLGELRQGVSSLRALASLSVNEENELSLLIPFLKDKGNVYIKCLAYLLNLQ